MEFREISENDIPALFAVRVATRENTLSMEQLTGLGITEESVLICYSRPIVDGYANVMSRLSGLRWGIETQERCG